LGQTGLLSYRPKTVEARQLEVEQALIEPELTSSIQKALQQSPSFKELYGAKHELAQIRKASLPDMILSRNPVPKLIKNQKTYCSL
jgi:hypothetical protein